MTISERQPRRWTSTEDQTLREQVEAQQAEGKSRDWCRVALALPGRTNKDCRKRWHNSVAEGLRKGQWSKSEDELLTNGVHQFGSKWTLVANCVSSRSADQCAKRWQQSLDPRLDRSEWRVEEDVALLGAVDRLGRHWKDIQQQYLPHRSKNCVKNRYSVLARRNATQAVPYADSLYSSSSNPGTPLPMEAEGQIERTSMPVVDHQIHTPHLPAPMVVAGNNELSWVWSRLNDSVVSTATSHHELLNTNFWDPNQGPSTYITNQCCWNSMDSIIDSQHPMQYSGVSNQLMQDYTFPSIQQPHVPLALFCTSPLVRPVGTTVYSSRPPSSPAHCDWFDYQGRDTGPYR